MLFDLLSTNPDWIQTAVRIILGVVFFAHGAQKLLGWFGGPGSEGNAAYHARISRASGSAGLRGCNHRVLWRLGAHRGIAEPCRAIGIGVTMLSAIVMVNGRYGLFLNWFGDRKGHGYEYHLLAIALAAVIVVRGSGATVAGSPLIHLHSINSGDLRMTLRTLGQSDLKITPIGIGAWAIGGGQWEFAWGAQDDTESIAAIHAGLDRGINWIDTAAAYGLGHSETIVGRAIKGLAKRPYIFTKCSLVWDEIRKNLAQPAGCLHSAGSRGQPEAAGSG